MKRIIHITTSITAIVLLSLASCKKNDHNPPGNPGNGNPQPSKLNNLFDELKPNAQTFTVQSGNYERITGSNGLVLTFYPETFLDSNNNPIAPNSPVELKLTEALTYNDMLLNRVQTATESNQRLISGGAFHLEAKLNGQALKANKYGAMFPAGNTMPTTPMSLFTGYTQEELGGTTVMWYDDTTGTNLAQRTQGQNTAFMYVFDSVANFGWINCDYFYSNPGPKTDIGVTMPDSTFNNENTEVFVVFPAINSVTGMYNYLSNSKSFLFGYSSYFLPIGTTIHVLTFTEKDDAYFMSVTENITITNNHTVMVNPTEVNLTAILDAVANL